MRRIDLPDRLSDGDIVLDGHTMDDAEAHRHGEDEEMRRRFDDPQPTAPATVEQTRAAIGRWMDARVAGGPMIAYAVRQRSGSLIGGCEVRLLSSDRANVSYWIFPQFRGRGYATRALRLLCESAARIEGLRRLEAHIGPDNIASQRVAQKVGFVEVVHAESETVHRRRIFARSARAAVR
jgi:RimJ/RimL family protein N-acetyltransferase